MSKTAIGGLLYLIMTCMYFLSPVIMTHITSFQVHVKALKAIPSFYNWFERRSAFCRLPSG